jgi:hypothetical protein
MVMGRKWGKQRKQIKWREMNRWLREWKWKELIELETEWSSFGWIEQIGEFTVRIENGSIFWDVYRPSKHQWMTDRIRRQNGLPLNFDSRNPRISNCQKMDVSEHCRKVMDGIPQSHISTHCSQQGIPNTVSPWNWSSLLFHVPLIFSAWLQSVHFVPPSDHRSWPSQTWSLGHVTGHIFR